MMRQKSVDSSIGITDQPFDPNHESRVTIQPKLIGGLGCPPNLNSGPGKVAHCLPFWETNREIDWSADRSIIAHGLCDSCECARQYRYSDDDDDVSTEV